MIERQLGEDEIIAIPPGLINKEVEVEQKSKSMLFGTLVQITDNYLELQNVSYDTDMKGIPPRKSSLLKRSLISGIHEKGVWPIGKPENI